MRSLLLKNSFYMFLLFLCFNCTALAQAIIDANVLKEITLKNKLSKTQGSSNLSVLVFLNKNADKKRVFQSLQAIPGIKISDLGFMPAFAIEAPADKEVVKHIAEVQAAAQITLYKASDLELDKTAQILKLTPSPIYQDVSNWWAHGYTGKKGIVGIIDTGIDISHPALSEKKIILRQEEGSDYSKYRNGVKEPHATGVACIYASNDAKYQGMAPGASVIVSGLAGNETADTSSLMLTMSTLDWMLNRSGVTPSIINYSMGNGKLACPDCPEWSGLAKVMDYVINTKKVLWVKSAGNMGYIDPTYNYPYASTLTVPGDNYNGLTIANMDTTVIEGSIKTKVVDRSQHHIKATSSRGPTPFGRRKPDLTAPGHDTRTCAPDPNVFDFKYSLAMEYKDGFRLMGGTSSAAPHVGASALLLQDAGITEPMAIKALLINSADTWTDDNTDAPRAHGEIMGSAWNRTYGWGYINMDKAFKQRKHIILGTLSLEKPSLEFETTLAQGEKITLVHERRVGYTTEGVPWKLSPLSLEIFDLNTGKLLDKDSSPLDSVHQVSNCRREPHQRVCSNDTSPLKIKVKVSLLSTIIDGASNEAFALASEEAIS